MGQDDDAQTDCLGTSHQLRGWFVGGGDGFVVIHDVFATFRSRSLRIAVSYCDTWASSFEDALSPFPPQTMSQ